MSNEPPRTLDEMIDIAKVNLDPEYIKKKEREEQRREERKDAIQGLWGFFVLFLLPGILVFIAYLN